MTDEIEPDRTVLVVDDETSLADLYTTILETEYTVRTATSGSEALQKADDAVDVVLLDRRMPDMAGDEVLAELREQSLTAQVAMLTAVEPDVDIVEMPFDDYKVKPVDRSDLLGLVETLLERATYDEHSQEFFSLASKKASLEIAGKDDTEEYDQVSERMAEVRTRVDSSLDNVSAEAAFSDLLSDTE
jgi:DNA-binding response OmpR family regulator